MGSRWQGIRAALGSALPWAALAACLALTAAAWYALEHNRHQQAQAQFERRTDAALSAVRTRILSYEQVLRSGAARMASSPTVSREEWRLFVSRLELEEHYPGIHAMGYAERAGLDATETATVLFNEPAVPRNARLIGTDLRADPVQRSAMDQARASLDVAITARVALPAEASRGPQARQSGFILFMPVVPELPRSLPPAERRSAVSGFVFTSLRVNELMRALMDEGVMARLDLRIIDQANPIANEELIDTRAMLRPGIDRGATPPLFQRTLAMAMPGRNWTVQFVSRPEFDQSLRDGRPWIALAGGILASFVVFVLTAALSATWQRAHQLSMRDPLTGLYNRRYLEETIARELPRARREGRSVGLVLLDLDHFKRLNDTFGHNAGDYVLAQLGELLRALTRGSDMACRLGGEEFAVVMPGADREVARRRAEHLRAALEGLRLEFGARAIGPVTLSAGVSALPPHGRDWAHAMQGADRALYAAKQAGRNRVVVDEAP